jgi:cysteinyl-tRNA synthetase
MAGTQYRRPIRYSETGLQEAATNLEKLHNADTNVEFRQADASAGEDEQITQQVADLTDAFTTAMDDDFNVQNGLATVYDLAKLMNEYAATDAPKADSLALLRETLATWLQIFGVHFEAAGLLDADVDAKIAARDEARANKDFATSDAIRDELQSQGIILEDTPQGTRWRRK